MCSLFKRSIVSPYHGLSVQHMPAYLDQMEWRFNNRDNPYLFSDTLLVLLRSDPLPYREFFVKPGSKGKAKKPSVKPVDTDGHWLVHA